MKMDIVRQLVDGSANLDRMAKETDQLVKMIRGLVVNSIPPKGIEVSFESETYKWDMSGRFNPGREPSITIECWIKEIYGATSGYTTQGQYQGYRTTIQRVYESLPLFIEGMLKTFPHLTEELRPFIEASKVYQ